METNYDRDLIARIAYLEGKLELEERRNEELERIIKEATVIVTKNGLNDYNTGWYLRAKREIRE